jgi:hypothetical protein
VASNPVACDGQFDVVASPNGTGNNYLDSTSAISANDVWAVGNSTNASNLDRTLAEHWNGATWSIVPTVNPGALHNDLFGVSAISSSDVWAVGFYETNSTTGTSSTIAEHWNGTSWSKVPTVNPSTYSYLFAVTAVSSGSVWAVGTYWNFGNGAYQTLVEHFNGATWVVVPSANLNPFTDNQLFAVSAWSDTDVWAVGSLGPLGSLQPLAEHWDGSGWSSFSTPGTAFGDNEILGVTALEPGHAVGVGYGGSAGGPTPRQGATWDLLAGGGSSIIARSSSVSGDNVFESVARASGGLWAVGYTRVDNLSPGQTLVWAATWDSTTHSLTWSGSPGTSASPGAFDSVLFGVTAISPSVFWATGYENGGAADQTLTEQYCALHFTVGAPGTATTGSAFSLTVTAKNANATTATGYGGTVHFTSSDPLAVLPGDYTFTPGDSGTHTFTGVMLNSPYQDTITASDTVTPFVTGSATISVSCPGVCQSTGGTPGARGANQSPSVPAPGTRVPSGISTHKARIGVQAAPPRTINGSAAIQGGDAVLVSSAATGSPQATEYTWNVGLVSPLGLIVLALLALRR